MCDFSRPRPQAFFGPWHQPAPGRHHCPSGSVLVCVLVCVSVASALVVSTVGTAVRAHRQLRRQRQLLQTELLVEAGIERAVRRLRKDPQYGGETWELAGNTLPGNETGRVRIAVAAELEQAPQSFRIEVVARLGGDSIRGIQRSHKMLVATDPGGTKPP